MNALGTALIIFGVVVAITTVVWSWYDRRSPWVGR